MQWVASASWRLAIATTLLAGSVNAAHTPGSTPDPSSRCDFAPQPASGPPRTRVFLTGVCSGILYHRRVAIYFDQTLVADFDGVASDYAISFVVPAEAAVGTHVLRIAGALIPAGVTAPFEVTAGAASCVGDCNLDSTVSIDELLVGMNIALAIGAVQDCPSFDANADDRVGVEELVKAVRNALDGCPQVEDGCRDANSCGSGFYCRAPGEFRGCGVCLRYFDDCESDVDCQTRGERFICDSIPETYCPCLPAQICQPGCASSAECGAAQECDATFRCVPKQCTEGECPPHFACEPGTTTSPVCLRAVCNDDADCTAGYCVNQRCYEALGLCSLPRP